MCPSTIDACDIIHCWPNSHTDARPGPLHGYLYPSAVCICILGTFHNSMLPAHCRYRSWNESKYLAIMVSIPLFYALMSFAIILISAEGKVHL